MLFLQLNYFIGKFMYIFLTDLIFTLLKQKQNSIMSDTDKYYIIIEKMYV